MFSFPESFKLKTWHNLKFLVFVRILLIYLLVGHRNIRFTSTRARLKCALTGETYARRIYSKSLFKAKITCIQSSQLDNNSLLVKMNIKKLTQICLFSKNSRKSPKQHFAKFCSSIFVFAPKQNVKCQNKFRGVAKQKFRKGLRNLLDSKMLSWTNGLVWFGLGWTGIKTWIT